MIPKKLPKYPLYAINFVPLQKTKCTYVKRVKQSKPSTIVRNTVINDIKRMTQTIVYILIGINVLTFVIYGIDKWKAKRAKWRIREAVLLGLAVFGGSIGALLGMQVWHHKTMHKKFKYGLPLILLAQIALIYFINK